MKKQNKKKFLKKAGRKSEQAQKKRRARGEMLAALPAGVEDCRRPAAKRRLERAISDGARHTPPAMSSKNVRAGGRSCAPQREKRDTVVEGVFHGTGRGFGFVSPDGGVEDIFIPGAATGGALDGDRVRARYHYFTSWRSGQEEKKTEGEVTAILAYGRESVVATLHEEYSGYGRRRRRYLYAIAENTRIPNEIRLFSDGGAKDGDKIEVTLDRGSRPLSGEVTRVFGAADDRHANYEAVLSAHDVRVEFPAAVLAEAEARAAAPLSDEGRKRLTNEVIFTIDGAGAKDLDDAISLRRLSGGGWLLGVHIADVSEYVTAGSETDKEAMRRGTSIYFTDKVVPMLPPALSNGACSLNAGEDKYALSALVTLSPEGEIEGTRVLRTVIKSRVRGVYSEVNDLFEKGKGSPFAAKYRGVMPALARMRELYELLAARAAARGAMEFDRPEAVILLDEKGDPTEIVAAERGIAERLIEQFMITANEGVARLAREKKIPCVYRVHEPPETGRLQEFALYAHNLGLSTADITREGANGRDFAALLHEAEEKGLSRAVSYAMLRAMAKASYSESPKGHFGLGLADYCHFTSPIRRLSDLATHRMLKAVLIDGESAGKYLSYAARAASAASETELRALEAEREIDALYKTVYLAAREGEEFEATVSSCTSFGMFCELENTCEGLVPIDDLDGDFVYDEGHAALVSRTRSYRVGDAVRIRVEEADISRRRTRFSVL